MTPPPDAPLPAAPAPPRPPASNPDAPHLPDPLDDDLVAPPPLDEPDDASRWDPVGDGGAPDADEPGPEVDPVESNPWTTLTPPGADSPLSLLEEREEPSDLWGPTDARPDSAPGVLVAPTLPEVIRPAPPWSARPRARRNEVIPSIPWRLAVELLAPAPARLLCTADPRTARTRLLVAAWDWLPGDTPHLRFRLADDGLDVIARAESTEEPLVTVRLRIAGRELDGQALLAADRRERGLVLGRDLLAGRFVIDPAREEWG